MECERIVKKTPSYFKALFHRPKLTTRRRAGVEVKHVVYAILVIILLGLIWPYLSAGISRLLGPPPGIDDGINSIDKFRVYNNDQLNEGGAVTASAAYALLPDGRLKSASTLASGYNEWIVQIKEGDEITIEADSATNYYPQLKTFTVGDINEGTWEQTYYILGTMDIWGMDASSDAGVVTVMSGTTLMYNGTGVEDTLAVDANTEYEVSITFDWNAADEEYFGVEAYTQISSNKYSYVPVIKVIGSPGVKIDAMSQDNVQLTELYNVDNGDAVTAIFQLNPIREDEDISADGISLFTFKFTPDDASSDTLDITFHDETRKDRAESGATSQSAVETVAQLTTG